MTVELTAHGDRESTFKGVGQIDGQEMVKGRITLFVFAKRYDSNGNQLNVLNVAVGTKVEDKSSIAVTPDGRISVAYELAP